MQPLILLPGKVHYSNDCGKNENFFLKEDFSLINLLESHELSAIGFFSSEEDSFLKSTWRKNPEIYEMDLLDRFTLVFNPLSTFSVAVVSGEVLELLHQFETPNQLSSLLEKNPAVPPDQLFSIFQALRFLDFIQEEGQTNTKQISSVRTLTAWLHLTNECNLRCDYCYVSKSHESMSADEGKRAVDAVFRSAIAQSFKTVMLKYAGGEATLEFRLLLQLHDYAVEKAKAYGLHLDAVLLSNGVGFTNYMITEVKTRAIRLAISLDGIGEHHDSQRKFLNGMGSFSLVESSIDRLINQDLIPSITVTVSRRNADYLPQTVEYLLERKLPFTINFYRENECSQGILDLSYGDDQMIGAMRGAFAKIEKNLPSYSLLSTVTDRADLSSQHQLPCNVGQSYMVIDHHGNVAKCHMEINRKITSIDVADPLKVLQLDKTGIQNVSVDEKEECRECKWRYQCAGGCPALTYRVTGKYNVKSPNCNIYKSIFPEVLRLEGLRILKYYNISLSPFIEVDSHHRATVDTN